jgi:hypothetical protein
VVVVSGVVVLGARSCRRSLRYFERISGDYTPLRGPSSPGVARQSTRAAAAHVAADNSDGTTGVAQ